MPTTTRNTFKKSERLCSQILIDRLFQGESRSVAAFPIRAVFLPVDAEVQPGVSILISVPKKRFHDAVDRNRVKRQIREAYRLNKHLLHEALEQKKDTAVAMAFIWQSDELAETALITEKMQSLLSRMAEKISR